MDEEGFRPFLKRGGRKPHTVDNIIGILRRYEAYLKNFGDDKTIDQATPQNLEAYILWYEEQEKQSAKSQLWGIRYYYQFTGNKAMTTKASELRKERISKTRKAFRLQDFRGVDSDYIAKLEAVGIRDVKNMRERGATAAQRTELAQKTGIPIEAILEFVKLSDLARLSGVKGVRARLYYDAGVDTLEKMAKWDPEKLRLMLIEYVEKTGFDGIAPAPKEAANSVKIACELPKLIQY